MVSGLSRNSLWHIKSSAVTFILAQVASVSVGPEQRASGDGVWWQVEPTRRSWAVMSNEKIRGRNGEGEKPPTSGSLELVLGDTPQNGLFCLWMLLQAVSNRCEREDLLTLHPFVLVSWLHPPRANRSPFLSEFSFPRSFLPNWSVSLLFIFMLSRSQVLWVWGWKTFKKLVR